MIKWRQTESLDWDIHQNTVSHVKMKSCGPTRTSGDVRRQSEGCYVDGVQISGSLSFDPSAWGCSSLIPWVYLALFHKIRCVFHISLSCLCMSAWVLSLNLLALGEPSARCRSFWAGIFLNAEWLQGARFVTSLVSVCRLSSALASFRTLSEDATKLMTLVYFRQQNTPWSKLFYKLEAFPSQFTHRGYTSSISGCKQGRWRLEGYVFLLHNLSNDFGLNLAFSELYCPPTQSSCKLLKWFLSAAV